MGKVVDFIDKRKQEEEEARKWEEELRSKDADELTPEEIGILADLNDSFWGKYHDEEAEQRFNELTELTSSLLSFGGARQAKIDRPSQDRANASVYVDFPTSMVLNNEAFNVFKKMVDTADMLTIARTDAIRMTFTVRRIWRKYK